jgi:hypothetical protein
MSEPHSLATSSVERGSLSVVVLGTPGSGRSSLVEALSQNANNDQQSLKCHLHDLAEVHTHTTFKSNERSLAATLRSAHALILAIDISANPFQVDAELKEFARFLCGLEDERGRNNSVGGLPVFLVLTKSDLLADAKDGFATWRERVEDRKRQIHERFSEFFAPPREEVTPRFGRLSLSIRATALKRPALAEVALEPVDPYGVGELCRRVIDSGRDYRIRRTQSNKRLLWILMAVVGMAAGLLGLSLFLVIHRTHEDPRVRELTTKVESYRMREPMTPSMRLRGPLQLHISELTELQNDPDFASLPRANQEFVAARLQELESYRTFRDSLAGLPAPGDLHSERELQNVETKLTNLTPPAEHKSDWGQTEAVLLRRQRLEQSKALRGAVAAEEKKYRDLVRRGDELWTFSGMKEGTAALWPEWNKRVQSLLEEADAAQHQAGERLPGSEISYDSVLAFDNVAAVHDEWQRVAVRLQRISNLSAALGVIGPGSGRSPLDIRDGFTIDEASAREQTLKKAYPRFQEEFTLTDLPEAIVGHVRSAARARYDVLLKSGREAVLRHLQGITPGVESVDSWRQLRDWLDNPPELQAWRVLATVLARLQASDAVDPVTALAAFLKKDQFELRLSRLELDIPDNQKVRPAGRLVIHQQRATEANITDLTFELLDDGRHDATRPVTRFTFKPTAGTTLLYRPGDTLWADVPVKSDDQADWMLTWTSGRSQVYQFERLAQPPRLHRKDQPNLEGKMEEDIALHVSPEGGLPTVPDLMPRVPAR